MIDNLIKDIKDLLDRYTTDECGESQRDKFKEMEDVDFLNLFLNTLTDNDGLNLEDFKDDFETDLVINFDYNNY